VVQNANSQFALAIPQELAEQLGLKAEDLGKEFKIPRFQVINNILSMDISHLLGYPYIQMKWTVGVTNKADKQLKKLPEFVRSAFVLLARELEEYGPYRSNWSHYGKLKNSGNRYHCHISSGRPTYVVCWEITDKTIRVMEVYYVGTHENAPY